MEEKQKGGSAPPKAEELKQELKARIEAERRKAAKEFKIYFRYDTGKAAFILGKTLAFVEVLKMLEKL